MDLPITQKALFAQTRVQQALEAGAHYIDADDVREALDGFKGALDCQFGVHNDLLARIADLEAKLAEAQNSQNWTRLREHAHEPLADGFSKLPKLPKSFERHQLLQNIHDLYGRCSMPYQFHEQEDCGIQPLEWIIQPKFFV